MKKIRRFQLGAKNYTVKYKLEDDDYMGLAKPVDCEIVLCEHVGGDKIIDSQLEQTFFHELVHCILFDIGKRDESDDESFVQSFALLLHQFWRTAR